MASDKRTKKFNKKHLQSHLKERRKQKAIKDKKLKSDKDKAKKEKKKQKIITAEKEKIKKAREAEEANQSSEEEGENEINLLKPTKKSDNKKSKLDDDFEGMEVLQDDVEISSDDELEEDDAMDVSDEEVDDEEDTAMDISDEEDEVDDEDDDDEEDEEDDDEEDEDEEIQDDGEDVDGAIETMKHDMEALKEKDPDFYKYLQENDKGLLDFDVQDEEEDEDEDEDQEDDADSDDDSEESGKSVIVSLKLISNWEKQITEEKTHKACSQLLDAFKVGAHLHDDKKEDEDEESKPQKYKINSDKVFNQLMVKAMKLVPAYFNDTIKYKPNNNKLPNTYQNWKSIHNLAKSYLSSCLHMLQQLTEPTMLTFMLDRFDSILVYFASFPKLSRDLVKTLLKLFGSSQDDKVRLLAFITLKNLSRASKEFLDLSLKGVYMSYIRNAKNVTAFNLSQIEMMRNCGVELYGQDFAASYQHAFQFIRRLATHLRTSLTNKTKDSYQQVYNNQFIHSIYFWSQVLCSYCNSNSEQENGESPLKPLIYPFVQVTLGTLSLIPSPKYFPLKFHCIKALIPIMQSTKVYIPIAPYLIEILESSEFQKKPKPSTEKPLNFDVVIKAPKNHLRTKPYQDELSRLVNECFLAYFSCLSTSIAFPEVVLPTTLYLKRFAKKTAPNTPRFVQVLLTKIKETSDMVNQKRENVKFNPGNLNSLKTFMRDTDVFKTPLGQQYKQIVKVNQSRKRTLQTQNNDE